MEEDKVVRVVINFGNKTRYVEGLAKPAYNPQDRIDFNFDTSNIDKNFKSRIITKHTVNKLKIKQEFDIRDTVLISELAHSNATENINSFTSADEQAQQLNALLESSTNKLIRKITIKPTWQV